MPTLSGARRRGYTPETIREFCDRIGVVKRDNLIDIVLLEFCLREHLNKIAERRIFIIGLMATTIANEQDSLLQFDNVEFTEIFEEQPIQLDNTEQTTSQETTDTERRMST